MDSLRTNFLLWKNQELPTPTNKPNVLGKYAKGYNAGKEARKGKPANHIKKHLEATGNTDPGFVAGFKDGWNSIQGKKKKAA